MLCDHELFIAKAQVQLPCSVSTLEEENDFEQYVPICGCYWTVVPSLNEDEEDWWVIRTLVIES